MTPPATNEEREAAADRFSGRMMTTQNIMDTVKLYCGDTVCVLRAGIEAEIALTRTEARNAALEAQVKEARELLHCADWNEEMEHAMSQNEWDKRFIKLSRETK